MKKRSKPALLALAASRGLSIGKFQRKKEKT